MTTRQAIARVAIVDLIILLAALLAMLLLGSRCKPAIIGGAAGALVGFAIGFTYIIRRSVRQ